MIFVRISRVQFFFLYVNSIEYQYFGNTFDMENKSV